MHIIFNRMDGLSGLFSYVNTGIRQIQYAQKYNCTFNIVMDSSFAYPDSNENLIDLCFSCNSEHQDFKNDDSKTTMSEIFGVPEYLDFYDNVVQFKQDVQIAKQFFKPSKEVSYTIADFFKQFPSYSKIIGVFARGTDYVKCHPYRHPVQPTMNKLIASINEKAKNIGNDFMIYLVTESFDIVKSILEAFSDKVIIPQKKHLVNFNEMHDGKYIMHAIQRQLDFESYKQLLMQYAANMFILSKLQHTICTITSATIFLHLISECKDAEYMWLGRYGD